MLEYSWLFYKDMPIIKSAIKKLRQDRKRTSSNNVFRRTLKASLSSAKKEKTAKAVKSAISLLDKAVKKNIIHANKANRAKSSLSKLARIGPTKQIKATIKKKSKPLAPTTKKASSVKTKKPTSKK